MRKRKKAWVKPELVVLVRSKAEEGVLTGCKTNTGNDGYDMLDNRCALQVSGECSGNCNSIVSS